MDHIDITGIVITLGDAIVAIIDMVNITKEWKTGNAKWYICNSLITVR